MRGNRIFFGALVFWLGLVVGKAGLPLPEAGQNPALIEKPGRFPDSIVTWNLQWFPGNRPVPTDASRTWHEQQVRIVLRELDADLLMVQEVVDLKALGRVTPAYPWRAVSNFQRAVDEDGDLPVQNVAILSKVPIRESWEVGFHNLPLTPDRPVRGFLAARFGTKKKGITVYTIHLKSNRGGREVSGLRRERAMEYLRKDWEKRGLYPEKDQILVAGDFNCSLRNPEFAKEQTIWGLLKEGWVSVTEEIPWPVSATVKADLEGKFPASDFDHILLSPAWAKAAGGGRWRAGVIQNSKVPSDHYPVVLRMKETSH